MTKTDKEISDWVINTCLFFGTSLSTALIVAGIFIEGLNRETQQINLNSNQVNHTLVDD